VKLHHQYLVRPLFLVSLALAIACASFVTRRMSAQTATGEPPRDEAQAAASPTPTPRPRDEVPQDSDEVIKVETNLTSIFFTAADKNKRFVSTLKPEDIRVLEDGQPQQIFTFQQNVDLPLSLAILIDTSASEERTLPDLKAAAQAFLENLIRPAKDEVAVISFTGETTLEQSFTGSVERLRRAIDRVEFVPPSGYVGGGVVVNGTPPISGVAWELVPALALLCAYGAFEAVRYVLTLSSMAQEMRALSDYQVTATRAAEDALPETGAK